jgi:acetoin utilization deacetylase AcuC-like enzyme
VLTPAALRTMGKRLAELRLPLLVVQEGGYNVRNIRQGSVAFFAGCAEGAGA